VNIHYSKLFELILFGTNASKAEGSQSHQRIKYGHESCEIRTKNDSAGEGQQQFSRWSIKQHSKCVLPVYQYCHLTKSSSKLWVDSAMDIVLPSIGPILILQQNGRVVASPARSSISKNDNWDSTYTISPSPIPKFLNYCTLLQLTE
jgi:hypothetical protein